MPPTIIFHCTADTTVPYENVERFQKKMREAGNRCELVTYEDQAHGFFNHDRNIEIYVDTVRESRPLPAGARAVIAGASLRSTSWAPSGTSQDAGGCRAAPIIGRCPRTPRPEPRERVAPEELQSLVDEIFESCGMSAEDAALLADSLVAADIAGIHSHGVLRVPEYVRKLRGAGGVDPQGRPQVVSDRAAALVIDGGNAMGQITCRLRDASGDRGARGRPASRSRPSAAATTVARWPTT